MNVSLLGKVAASLVVTGVCVAYAVHGVDRNRSCNTDHASLRDVIQQSNHAASETSAEIAG